ncbi:MAG: hypothetical protein OQL20_06985 [Sedimenticola sp.]|nr:hypothetical protein [Sedimenticola sp.]
MATQKQRKIRSKSRSKMATDKRPTSVTAPGVDTTNRPRRGRPVSVDALKRKLETLQLQLSNEKQKRRDQLHNAQLKISTLTAERRALRQQLGQTKKRLQQIESEQKSLAREEALQRRIEEARNLAVAKFLQKWDRQQAKSLSAKKRKPGRPRKS